MQTIKLGQTVSFEGFSGSSQEKKTKKKKTGPDFSLRGLGKQELTTSAVRLSGSCAAATASSAAQADHMLPFLLCIGGSPVLCEQNMNFNAHHPSPLNLCDC